MRWRSHGSAGVKSAASSSRRKAAPGCALATNRSAWALSTVARSSLRRARPSALVLAWWPYSSKAAWAASKRPARISTPTMPRSAALCPGWATRAWRNNCRAASAWPCAARIWPRVASASGLLGCRRSAWVAQAAACSNCPAAWALSACCSSPQNRADANRSRHFSSSECCAAKPSNCWASA